MSCIVPGCGKSRYTCKDDTHFHRFPKDPELSEKWRIAIRRRRHAPITKSSLVCSAHFTPEDFSSLPSVPSLNGFKLRIKLKPTAIPSVFPPRDKIKKSQLLQHAARLQAAKAEKSKTASKTAQRDPTGTNKQRFYIMVPKHKIAHPTGTGFLLPGTTVKVQFPEGGTQLLTVRSNPAPVATHTTAQGTTRTAFETVFLNSNNIEKPEERQCEVDMIGSDKCDSEPAATETTPNIKQEKSELMRQPGNQCHTETTDVAPSCSIKQENEKPTDRDYSKSEAYCFTDSIDIKQELEDSTQSIQIKQEKEDGNSCEAPLNFTEPTKDFKGCKLEPICSIVEQNTELHIKEEQVDQNFYAEYSPGHEFQSEPSYLPTEGPTDMWRAVEPAKHEIYASLAKTLGQNKFNSKVLARMEIPGNHRTLTFECRFCPEVHRALIRCKSNHIRLLCCRCLSSSNFRTPGALKTHLRNVHHLDKCQVEVNTYILIMQRVPPAKITLRCAFCEQAQSSARSLGTHLKNRHGFCRYCGPIKDASIDAVDHVDKHMAAFKHLFKCSICKTISVTKAQMFQHFSTEHVGCEVEFSTLNMDVTKEHACPYCYFCTDVYEILQFHMFLHTFKCCYNCNEVFLLPAKSVQNAEFKYCTKCDGDLRYPSIEDLPCLYCDARLATGVSLYEHQRLKHHRCGVCNLGFLSLEDLTQHESVYHRLYFECLHCPLKFLNGNDINIHRLKIHTKVKYYGIQGKSKANYWLMNEDRDKFQYEKIMTSSHCGYCCAYLPHSFEFEEHLELKHNVSRCTKCLQHVISDVCANCVQESELQDCPENNCMLVYDT